MKSELLTRRTVSHMMFKFISKNKLKIAFTILLGIAATFTVAALLTNNVRFIITLPGNR